MPVLSFCSLDVCADSSGDSSQDHRHLSLVRCGLRKIFSPQNFFSEEEPLFPATKIVPLPEGLGCSVLLVCPFYSGVEKFFYEMASRWLCPGRQIAIRSFSYCTFFFSANREKRFSFCEAQFLCQDEQEREDFLLHFAQIEPEMKLGALSVYRGNRILELRGMCFSNKNSVIQEKIGSLIQRRPQDFDYDIFGQMQHFLVTCREDFKQVREASHLSRIIYIFYLFRKFLRKDSEKNPEKRSISFKVGQTALHSPFGVRKVLGIFVGLTMLKEHEIFEERHLIQAIQEYIPSAKLVEGSRFFYHQKEDKIHVLYVEIEKELGEVILQEEIRDLRENLPALLESQIESLVPDLFMPRNEEEVMKNIVLLSHQLKYTRDIPQVLISFEEQTDQELSFTVILLRVLMGEETPAIRDLFRKVSSEVVFVEDRIKHVGLVRGKYKKEACVFRLKVDKTLYMRRNHSVDLLKARQGIAKELQKIIGEFRDYNGGMIAKQIENLQALKKFFPKEKDLDLEGFFQDIFPVEIRGVVNPSLLKILYEFWINASKSTSVIVENGSVIFLRPFTDALEELVKRLGLSSSQMLFFSSKKNGIAYFGAILSGLSKEKIEMLVESISE